MSKKRDIGDDEGALWSEVVSDVEPLKKIKPKKPEEPKNPVIKRRKFVADSTPEFYTPTAKKAEIDPATKAKIAGGHYKIDARIDLHGFTLDNAFSALEEFIANHHYRGSRLLLVITGKGGILQDDVPRWLSFARVANMVAYHTVAQTRHGGTGARYVYLARRR